MRSVPRPSGSIDDEITVPAGSTMVYSRSDPLPNVSASAVASGSAEKTDTSAPATLPAGVRTGAATTAAGPPVTTSAFSPTVMTSPAASRGYQAASA